MSTPETAFHDLRPSDYPFTIELLDTATREVVWEVTVPGPGAVQIPGRAESNAGRPVSCRVTFPWGGQMTMDGPP